MVTIKNLSERTFIIQGDVKLAPRGEAEMSDETEALRLVTLYEGELEIVETKAKPAKPEKATAAEPAAK